MEGSLPLARPFRLPSSLEGVRDGVVGRVIRRSRLRSRNGIPEMNTQGLWTSSHPFFVFYVRDRRVPEVDYLSQTSSFNEDGKGRHGVRKGLVGKGGLGS